MIFFFFFERIFALLLRISDGILISLIGSRVFVLSKFSISGESLIQTF